MITQTRDLRTGVSYSQAGHAPRVPTSPLTADAETEALVIGAGITGSVIAEFLSERHQIVVVDRRGPAKGSTVASTALVEYEIDTPLTHLSRSIRPGARAARLAPLASCAACTCRQNAEPCNRVRGAKTRLSVPFERPSRCGRDEI